MGRYHRLCAIRYADGVIDLQTHRAGWLPERSVVPIGRDGISFAFLQRYMAIPHLKIHYLSGRVQKFVARFMSPVRRTVITSRGCQSPVRYAKTQNPS